MICPKVILLFLLTIIFKLIRAATVDEFTTIEVGNTCLYVSNFKIWPYMDNDIMNNAAKSACADIYTRLAILDSQDEDRALLEFSRCKMSLTYDETILIDFDSTSGYNPSGLPSGKKCYFQKSDGSHDASDGKNCQDWFTDANGEKTSTVHFVCKKKASCSELPNCQKRPEDPTKCDMNLGKLNFAAAKANCDANFGYLPRIVSELDYQKVPDWSWVGLTSDVTPLKICGSRNMDMKGVSLCIASQQNFYWDGGKVMPKLPLSFDQAKFMRDMHVDVGDKCFIRAIGMIHDHGCSTTMDTYCTIDLSPNGMGRNLIQPNFLAGGFTCAPPSAPPTTPNMVLDADQEDIMCIGHKARYICNVGGVNIRADDKTKSTLDVECLSSKTYANPNPWPICIDRLDCPEPFVDDLIMKHDWNSSKGLTPVFSVSYECLWPNKKVISKRDLSNKIDSNVLDTLKVNCRLNGTYDLNIDDYTCTRPCPVQNVPEPDIMKHDWNNSDANPEIYQEVRYSCLNGRHLVSKLAFVTAKPTQFLEELMSSCQVEGWLNETIGSYTCTRGCETPLNFSKVFTYDWNPSKGSDIGMKIKYSCNNPTKKVVDLSEDNSPLYDYIEVECQYNGQYSAEIEKFGCTECARRADPPNGHIACESKRYEVGKSCTLECNAGYMPVEKTLMTCIYDAKANDYFWDADANRFACSVPIGLVVGGEDADLNYLQDVEVLAPGYNCSDTKIEPYPLKVTGASAGFVEGQTLVCGGGMLSYADCSVGKEGSSICGRNIECVTTAGGSKWCTGPKTDACYTLDLYGLDGWTLAINLGVPRAHAASVVTKDGSFWLIGGTGVREILKSTQKLNYIGGQWRKVPGPSLPESLSGACATPLNLNDIVVAGGYSMKTFDYNDKAYILDTRTKTWYTKPWAKLASGPRFDMACAQVNWSGDKVSLTAGGWNNSAVSTTEIFLTNSLKYSELLSHQKHPPTTALPVQLRSAVMAELDSVTILAGGVICAGKSKQAQNCQRTGKVFRLIRNLTSLITEDATWVEDSQHSLKVPRSGHALLIVPATFAPKCKRTNGNKPNEL